MKDDIANVRTTSDPYMQINHDCVENNNDVDNKNGTNFALKQCYLASSDKKTFYNASTDISHTYFFNAAKTIGIYVDAEKEEQNKANSFYPSIQSMSFLMANRVLLQLFRMYLCSELHTTKISAT